MGKKLEKFGGKNWKILNEFGELRGKNVNRNFGDNIRDVVEILGRVRSNFECALI